MLNCPKASLTLLAGLLTSQLKSTLRDDRHSKLIQKHKRKYFKKLKCSLSLFTQTFIISSAENSKMSHTLSQFVL